MPFPLRNLKFIAGLLVGLASNAPAIWGQPVFDGNSATLQNRYLTWESGMTINLQGYGAIDGVTQVFTIGPVETVDGIATLKVATDRSNDFPQQFWMAQDTEGNIWQLRNIDGLTQEVHEEDVLYIPANPQVGEVYDLFDITFASKYEVVSTTASVETPLQTFENCLLMQTTEDGVLEETWIAPFLGIVRTQAAGGAGGFEITSTQEFTPPSAPSISVQPKSHEIIIGAAARLYVHVVSEAPATFQWYSGQSGDTSNPLVGLTEPSFQTPIIYTDENYWVRATIGTQILDSETAILTAVADTSGPKLYGFGRNHWGQLGQGRTSIDPLPATLIQSDVQKASAGVLFSALITSDNVLMGTGQNSDGQMGVHVAFDFIADPQEIDTDVIDLSAGAAYIMYIKSDNTLWGIGSNSSGELGDGTTDRTWEPVQVTTDVVSVRAGRHASTSHTLFIKSDATLWGMGANSTGQLGDGGSVFGRTSPIQIATDVVQASPGNGHSLYITSNGNLYAMGWNQLGQLGDKTFETRTFPVLIDTDVRKAAGGNNQSYYIKNDGTLMAMGANLPGQGPETNDPIILDTDVDDIEPGYGQTGVYLKDGEWLSVKDGSFVLSGYPDISLGSEHTLYVLNEVSSLSPIPIKAIPDMTNGTMEIEAFPRSVFINYQLFSSFDLRTWTLHPEQNKSIVEDSLYFEIDYPSNSNPQFFQVLGAE